MLSVLLLKHLLLVKGSPTLVEFYSVSSVNIGYRQDWRVALRSLLFYSYFRPISYYRRFMGIAHAIPLQYILGRGNLRFYGK